MNNEIVVNIKGEILDGHLMTKLSDYQNLIDDIATESETILDSYFSIGSKLNEIKIKKLYELEDYNDIYEFAEDKFNFKSTAVKNMINVFLKYRKPGSNYLMNEFSNYSFTSLVELLPVNNNVILKDYTSQMTTREIRQTKKVSQLTDYLKKCIERFENIVNRLKLKVDVINKKLDKKCSISFKLSHKQLDLKYFDYSYCFSTSFYGFKYLYWDYLKLNLNGEIIYSDESLIDLSDEEILLKFENIFDEYLKFVNDQKKESEKKDDIDEEEIITSVTSRLTFCHFHIFTKKMISLLFCMLSDLFISDYDIKFIDFYIPEKYSYFSLVIDEKEIGYLKVIEKDKSDLSTFILEDLEKNNLLEIEFNYSDITVKDKILKFKLLLEKILELI